MFFSATLRLPRKRHYSSGSQRSDSSDTPCEVATPGSSDGTDDVSYKTVSYKRWRSNEAEIHQSSSEVKRDNSTNSLPKSAEEEQSCTKGSEITEDEVVSECLHGILVSLSLTEEPSAFQRASAANMWPEAYR